MPVWKLQPSRAGPGDPARFVQASGCLRDSEFMKKGSFDRKAFGGAGSSLPGFWAYGQEGTSDAC